MSELNEHVDNLLARVEKRVPKLIDQLALAEIRAAVKQMRNPEYCGKCARIKSALRHIARLSNDPEILKTIQGVIT